MLFAIMSLMHIRSVHCFLDLHVKSFRLILMEYCKNLKGHFSIHTGYPLKAN
jgi:hypothetical protein